MMDVKTGRFGRVYRSCEDFFSTERYIPYYYRARLDEASFAVIADDGRSSHGRFQFYFRALIAMYCAEKSFPIWEGSVKNSDMANFKSLIIEGLNSNYSGKIIDDFCNSMDNEIQSRIYEWEDDKIDTSGAAGLSCVTALRTYLGQFLFHPTGGNEKELDVHWWDSAFHSSIAIAHGAEWQVAEKDLDIDARTAFWEWYIRKAVPDAFDEANRRAF